MIAVRRARTLPIGLHLSARSATLAQLAGRPGAREVAEIAHAELPQVDGASPEDYDRETAAALRRLVANHGFRGRQVVSCLGAHELFVQNVRLPQLPPEEIDKVVRWEADERLPFPAAEAEVRHIIAGQVRQDAGVKQEVILLACRRELIERHVRILEGAGLVPVAVDVEPCAVLRSLRRPAAGDEELRSAYLHLGDRATTVLLAEGDRVLFLKSIAGGGAQLDQAVARHLSLSEAEAARMRAAVTAAEELDAENEVHRSVIDAIRGPLESMVSEIELCLRYFKVTFRGKGLETVTATGSEASRWLVDFLGQRLATPCVLGDPFAALGGGPAAALLSPWKWTTAIGLSLKGDD